LSGVTTGDDVPFLSAHDSARLLTELARRFASEFEAFGARAEHGPPAARVQFATTGRVLGEHAQALAALVPESVLLADARAEGAAVALAQVDAPLDALEELDRALAGVARRATPVADGALLRAAARARADLGDLVRAIRALEAADPGV
jgi:hypothetical protein